MTTFLAYIFIPAFLLVLAFVVGVVVVALRSHYRGTYAPSPYSRVTPLGYYSAQQGRRVTQGMPGSRSHVPYLEEAETVKVEVRRD